MKQTTFLLLAVLFFVSCNRCIPCTSGYTAGHPCSCIIFKAKIGTDFDSALDSLERLYKSEFIKLETNGYYSGKGYFIEKEKINVDFPYDDRAFFFVFFMDSIITYRSLITNSDVLDEKGNYYIYDEGRSL